MTPTHPQIAYLFDIDGVLTDPELKKTNPEIFNQLIKRLQKQYPIGLNTGRSPTFISQEVLNPLEIMIKDKSLLINLYAIGEKGSVWITYNSKGRKKVTVDPEVTVPKDIQEKVRSFASQPEFFQIIFFDQTKQTMCTLELKQGKSINEFQKTQPKLVKKINSVLKDHPQGHFYRVDPTRIAIDIENISVGKALGTERFTNLLKERNIAPLEYISFGDSPSDYDMHSKLLTLGKRSKFVFVGSKDQLSKKSLINVYFTASHFDKGTLEYLKADI